LFHKHTENRFHADFGIKGGLRLKLPEKEFLVFTHYENFKKKIFKEIPIFAKFMFVLHQIQVIHQSVVCL
jgi:hypothetical protein